ncbi:sensor histidine kinase [Patescibacteria group bacterium]|nr:MAG: sensor histidine kinase [Patescibacteria group bacterium]
MAVASRQLLDSVNRELYAKNAELAVRNKTMALLRRLDASAMTSLEVSPMAAEIVRILAAEFNYRIIAIALAEGRSLHWRAVACASSHDGLCAEVPTGRPIPLASRTNACVKAIRQGKIVRTKDLKDVFVPSYGASRVTAFETESGVQSVLVLPLHSDQEAVGVIAVGLNRDGSDLTEYERETLDGLMSLIVIAIQKAQTYESLQDAMEKLRAANRKLKDLDALKTEFLSIASHQLRTPLAVTKGYVAMLEDGMVGKVNKKQHAALETLRTSTESLILLVNHLLDLTRIESGRLAVREDKVDVTEICRWITSFIGPKAKEAGLSLTCDAPKKPVTVLADADKLKEVFMNLVDNAVKYTAEGKVTVTVRAEGRQAVVEVKDTGYGLSEADKRKLFQKFARGSASKNVKSSSGLGLYVVRKLMEAMHGSIEAESEGAGKGSAFTVRLPLSRP